MLTYNKYWHQIYLTRNQKIRNLSKKIGAPTEILFTLWSVSMMCFLYAIPLGLIVFICFILDKGLFGVSMTSFMSYVAGSGGALLLMTPLIISLSTTLIFSLPLILLLSIFMIADLFPSISTFLWKRQVANLQKKLDSCPIKAFQSLKKADLDLLKNLSNSWFSKFNWLSSSIKNLSEDTKSELTISKCEYEKLMSQLTLNINKINIELRSSQRYKTIITTKAAELKKDLKHLDLNEIEAALNTDPLAMKKITDLKSLIGLRARLSLVLNQKTKAEAAYEPYMNARYVINESTMATSINEEDTGFKKILPTGLDMFDELKTILPEGLHQKISEIYQEDKTPKEDDINIWQRALDDIKSRVPVIGDHADEIEKYMKPLEAFQRVIHKLKARLFNTTITSDDIKDWDNRFILKKDEDQTTKNTQYSDSQNILFIKKVTVNEALYELAAKDMADIFGFSDLIPANQYCLKTNDAHITSAPLSIQNIEEKLKSTLSEVQKKATANIKISAIRGWRIFMQSIMKRQLIKKSQLLRIFKNKEEFESFKRHLSFYSNNATPNYKKLASELLKLNYEEALNRQFSRFEEGMLNLIFATHVSESDLNTIQAYLQSNENDIPESVTSDKDYRPLHVDLCWPYLKFSPQYPPLPQIIDSVDKANLFRKLVKAISEKSETTIKIIESRCGDVFYIQRFIQETRPMSIFSNRDIASQDFDIHSLQRAFLLQYILGSRDAHRGNILFQNSSFSPIFVIDNEAIMPEDNYECSDPLEAYSTLEKDSKNVFPLRILLGQLPQSQAIPFSKEVMRETLKRLDLSKIALYHERSQVFSKESIAAQIERLLILKERFKKELEKDKPTLTPQDIYLSIAQCSPAYRYATEYKKLNDIDASSLLPRIKIPKPSYLNFICNTDLKSQELDDCLKKISTRCSLNKLTRDEFRKIKGLIGSYVERNKDTVLSSLIELNNKIKDIDDSSDSHLSAEFERHEYKELVDTLDRIDSSSLFLFIIKAKIMITQENNDTQEIIEDKKIKYKS